MTPEIDRCVHHDTPYEVDPIRGLTCPDCDANSEQAGRELFQFPRLRSWIKRAWSRVFPAADDRIIR